jgi:DNA repair protein RecO (recombination protein O)
MPTTHETNAMVLKTVNYSDTSLIVRLFTEHYGKVTVISKGARRPKQFIAGILQPPNHIAVWYSHKEGRDVQTLTKTEFVERYTQLTSSLVKGAAAMLAIEMLDRAVDDSDPHPILYRLITSTIRTLDQSAGNEMVILHFYQLHLAKQLGFGPRISVCNQCGKDLQRATLDMVTGHLLCDRCHPAGDFPLGQQALQYLKDLNQTYITDLTGLSPTSKTRKEVGDFLLNHLYYHVDGMSNLRSIKFWRQVAG